MVPQATGAYLGDAQELFPKRHRVAHPFLENKGISFFKYLALFIYFSNYKHDKLLTVYSFHRFHSVTCCEKLRYYNNDHRYRIINK